MSEMKTNNKALLSWIESVKAMCKPDKVSGARHTRAKFVFFFILRARMSLT